MTTLGKYELHEQLGKGSFGTVYRATDQTLDRVVALKILHPQLLTDVEFIERFRREAKIVASLDHPHVVPLYEIGEEDGRYFIAMKYMPGGSLKQRIEAGDLLPFSEALNIIEQVVEALNFIHNKGIIHRDLKPGNILFDEEGKVRIADFGLAKALLISASSSSANAFVGTPPYTAPEIWRNKGASAASDQYALGCIFYEMLTGAVLFDGDSPADIMTRHVLEGPQFSPEWPTPGVPFSVSPVIERVLAQDPQERFASLDDFFQALSTVSVNEPVSPLKDEPPEPEKVLARDTESSKRPAKRWPVLVLVLVLAAAGIILLAFLLGDILQPPPPQLPIATPPSFSSRLLVVTSTENPQSSPVTVFPDHTATLASTATLAPTKTVPPTQPTATPTAPHPTAANGIHLSDLRFCSSQNYSTDLRTCQVSETVFPDGITRIYLSVRTNGLVVNDELTRIWHLDGIEQWRYTNTIGSENRWDPDKVYLWFYVDVTEGSAAREFNSSTLPIGTYKVVFLVNGEYDLEGSFQITTNGQ